MSAHKKYISLPHLIQKIQQIEAKAKRMTYLLGYQSSDIFETHRKFITLCNSTAIIFIQYNLLQESLELLIKAFKLDVYMYRSGDLAARLWHGRILTYINLAFLFHK